MSLTEADAYDVFCRFRWSSNSGEPFCPRCGDQSPYGIRRRRGSPRGKQHPDSGGSQSTRSGPGSMPSLRSPPTTASGPRP
ncbi:transposase [Rhizobium giardinii]|uniref:transposase n=1 Tax=Rhizobium giardinii TaxID=56731 RepID=UPI003B835B06